SDISYFRVCLSGDTKLSFNKDVYSNALTDYSGLLPVQLKLVGNVSRNIISSNYTNAVNFYKYSTPTTFKISGGQFDFGTEPDNNATSDLFRITIGETTYSYITQTGISSISSFYQTTTTTGTAIAYINGGKTDTIGATTVLTLNSNTSSLQFNRLQISYTDEEKYLIQTRLDGVITTDFKWNWTESGEVTTRTAVLYIFSNSPVFGGEIGEWTKVVKVNGSLDYYYKAVTVNAVYSGENTELSVDVTLPKELVASSYSIYLKKSDSSLEGNQLSSKLSKAFNFNQLGRPTLTLQNGKINWNDISYATGYDIRFTGDRIGYEEVGTINSFELDASFASFADLTTERTYSFRIVADGNVPYLKPVQMPADNYTYIIAGQTSQSLSVVKPKKPGDIELIGGALKWEEQSYYTYANISVSDLEFVFYNSVELEIARVEIPANKFTDGFPDLLSVISDYLGGVKEQFSPTETYTIKYRELGGNSFANSEFKDLINNIVVAGNPGASYEFKLTPIVNRIEITEDEGLYWGPVTQEGLAAIKYDVFFNLNDSSYVYATTIDAPDHVIELEDLKALTAYQNNKTFISGIFIVVRGDSTNYISGFNSPIVLIKAIEGEVQLSVENGFIKWNDVKKAGKYQITTLIGVDTVVYEVYQGDETFKMNKYVNDILIQEGTLSSMTLEEVEEDVWIWSWDWAQDENIEAGILYNLFIRYIPEADEDVFAIPGEFTEVALSVYKLASPKISTINGDLTWSDVANANGYKIFINYLNSYDEILATTITELELNVNSYSVNIENHGQSKIMIAVQAVGTTETIGGFSYINNYIDYIDVSYKDNTLSNVVRSGDFITWDDSILTNSYVVDIYNENTNALIYSYTTSNKQVDLSTLGLVNSVLYKAIVKVRGTTGTIGESGTGYLSSIATDSSIQFIISNSIDTPYVESGEICWLAYDLTADYKVTIQSIAGNNYVYTIGLGSESGIYEVKGLIKNGVSIGFKSYVTEVDGTITFWPAEVEENKSMTISVRIVGILKGEVYYVSSNPSTLSSQVTKNLSTQLLPSYIVDENVYTFTWTNSTYFDYYVELVDSSGNVVTSSYVENNTFVYDFGTTTGTFTFRVQRYNADPNAWFLRSNFAIVEFTK
ncbi:MAG: hypothetical protein PHS54_03965, partial [Clostridia bacterium]|nr:hypothetical protein [Clostridia bacterium]